MRCLSSLPGYVQRPNSVPNYNDEITFQSYLAAAFAKKLSKLALIVPTSGGLVIIALIHNLLRRHPSINCLVHQEDDGETETVKSGIDHFNNEETDLLKTNAMREGRVSSISTVVGDGIDGDNGDAALVDKNGGEREVEWESPLEQVVVDHAYVFFLPLYLLLTNDFLNFQVSTGKNCKGIISMNVFLYSASGRSSSYGRRGFLKVFHMKVVVMEEMAGRQWMIGMVVTVDCVEIPISRVDADAAVVPAFLARSEGESGGNRRDPPRGKGGDHPPMNQDFHHSQLEFPRDDLRETFWEKEKAIRRWRD
ncbi:unnamed protein product [Lactuca saligna]|uniref:CCAAT-binding factor domain-containing protein n=1 Tax=Lactuca saligna TaxID=75948 RepID=A0AA35YQX8_LACSI|nr:unnamed protein product [Lactuca saligna]